MARWHKGEQAVRFLMGRGRLEGPAFAKPAFERLRRTRHSAQYFDPAAAPITEADASWAIGKATAALSGVSRLLAESPPDRFG